MYTIRNCLIYMRQINILIFFVLSRPSGNRIWWSYGTMGTQCMQRMKTSDSQRKPCLTMNYSLILSKSKSKQLLWGQSNMCSWNWNGTKITPQTPSVKGVNFYLVTFNNVSSPYELCLSTSISCGKDWFFFHYSTMLQVVRNVKGYSCIHKVCKLN